MYKLQTVDSLPLATQRFMICCVLGLGCLGVPIVGMNANRLPLASIYLFGLGSLGVPRVDMYKHLVYDCRGRDRTGTSTCPHNSNVHYCACTFVLRKCMIQNEVLFMFLVVSFESTNWDRPRSDE